jgi:hypothetical protein
MQCHENKARPKLGNSEIGRLKDLPIRLVAQSFEPTEQIVPVLLELRGGKSGNILKQHGTRSNPFNQSKSGREHIPLIIRTKLLAGYAEGRTGNPPRKQIDLRKIIGPQVPNVLLHHVPVRSVGAERRAELGLVFYRRCVLEARHLKPEGLSATTSAKF